MLLSMRLFRSRPVEQPEFETHQTKLQRLSGDVLSRYRAELDVEVHDQERLRAVYGSGFADAGTVRQAQTVALMATSLLKVPNSAVTIVLADTQQFIAEVQNFEVVPAGATPIEDSYCQHVIGTGREFAVSDSQAHPLVCDTTFAKAGQIVSYLGVPIANPHAVIVGVLCVYDGIERNWTSADVALLTQLSLVLTRSARMGA